MAIDGYERVLEEMGRLRDNDLPIFSEEELRLLRWSLQNKPAAIAVRRAQDLLFRGGVTGDISRELLKELAAALGLDETDAVEPRELGIDVVSAWQTIPTTRWRETYDPENRDSPAEVSSSREARHG